MISTRSEGLVIDTVISLTLPKWETLSGQFRGNLSPQVGWTTSRPARLRPARNRRARPVRCACSDLLRSQPDRTAHAKIGWEPHEVARAVQGRGRPPLQPSSTAQDLP